VQAARSLARPRFGLNPGDQAKFRPLPSGNPDDCITPAKPLSGIQTQV
jgi:hypothetical protein